MYHLFPLDHTVFSDAFQPKHISKTTRVSLFLSTRVVYYIYIRRCNLTSTVFRYSLFHGSSAFNTEPNPIANAFIFFRPKEEEEQKEANSSPSDTNTNANSEEKDGTVIIVVMEPDKEPFELQTNRRATSARTIKDYVIILRLFSM